MRVSAWNVPGSDTNEPQRSVRLHLSEHVYLVLSVRALDSCVFATKPQRSFEAGSNEFAEVVRVDLIEECEEQDSGENQQYHDANKQRLRSGQ